jgi:2-hydroxy-6-oxonona-2,4-dienedioate hydrolase
MCKSIKAKGAQSCALKQGFLKVNDLNIRYLESGNAISNANHTSEKHVLFIHGLGSSADRWLDIPDALSLQNLHTIAIDLPGFGLSDKPGINYTIGEFAKSITNFMHAAKINQASIVGHSLGGYVAAQLAIDHPELVEKLSLIDTSGMLDGPTPLLQQYLDAAMNPTKQAVRSVFEQMVADRIRIPEILVDGFIYRISQPGAQAAFRSAYDNSVHTKIGIDRLRQIKCPTQIIWGMQDSLIPLKYFKIFQEAIAHAEVVIVEDAGHAPFAEKPAIVSELLRRFLTANL